MSNLSFGCNIPSSAGIGGHKDHPYWDEANWEDLQKLAVICDNSNFDTIGFPDHLTIAEGTTFECFTALGSFAEITEDVYLYPKVTNVLFRNPALLAKMAANIDIISEGRLKLGLGAGWHKEEMKAYGFDWPNPAERVKRVEEATEIIKLLWNSDSSDYSGEYYQLNNAQCRPKPQQKPNPPIAIGGGGEKLTLRVVAKHADSWNWVGPIDDIDAKLQVLKEHCESVGRDFDEIEKSWFGRVVISEDENKVEDIVDAANMFDDMADAKSENLIGTPSEVCSQIEGLAEKGIEEVFVEFVDTPQLQSLSLFSDEVISQFK
jgi:alkanesulfonate monooxygenase SsuD/methylene tetrahydromethanopterin reductase-like flavin-dependent oxidoreductase (luciferase family)